MRALAATVLCACSFEHGRLVDVTGMADARPPELDGGRLDGRLCALGAWGTPQPIAELNAGTLDAMPRLTPNERIVFFHGMRTGGAGARDLWTATRVDTAQPFSAPVEVAELTTTAQDRDPTISGDGLLLVFASTRGGGEHDIYYASRTTVTSPFGTAQALGAVNTTGREYFSMLSADGLTLYFSADRAGGAGAYDIWYVTRPTTTTAFAGTPQNFTAINSADYEFGVVVSADGLELYLSAGPFSNPEIWRSTRETTSAAFAPPVLVPELNSAAEDHPGWLSNDGRRLYIASDRSGVFQIYVVARSCT